MAEHDTVLKAFLANCEKTPDKPFLTQPMGGAEVKTWTMKECLEEAKKMAAYLESKNFEKGSSIAICSKNCSWWIIADLASEYKQEFFLSFVFVDLFTYLSLFCLFFSLDVWTYLRSSLPHIDPRDRGIHLGALGI